MLAVFLFIGVCGVLWCMVSSLLASLARAEASLARAEKQRDDCEEAKQWLGTLETGTPVDAWVPPGNLREAFFSWVPPANLREAFEQQDVILEKPTKVYRVIGAPMWLFTVQDKQVYTVQTGLVDVTDDDKSSARL